MSGIIFLWGYNEDEDGNIDIEFARLDAEHTEQCTVLFLRTTDIADREAQDGA